MLNKNNRSILFLLAAAIIFSGGQFVVCFGQDESKSILPGEYVKRNRPATSKSRVKPSASAVKSPISKAGKAKKRFYRVVKSPTTKPENNQSTKLAPINTEEAMLGLTIWKLRPAAKDNAVKGLIEEEAGGRARQPENTLERNESETPLAVNDRIRLSVESLSRSGYLYVIERELYSDGTFSAPQLIYPTLRTVKGNKPISAGNLIFVPESANFVVTSQQIEKKQTAEVLTFIISPRILIESSLLKDKAIDLPATQFADWLKQWEVETTLFEQIDGAGQTITPIEQAAGDSAKGLTEETSALTRDDPPPQTIYRAGIKRGNPLLVNVFLKFRSN